MFSTASSGLALMLNSSVAAESMLTMSVPQPTHHWIVSAGAAPAACAACSPRSISIASSATKAARSKSRANTGSARSHPTPARSLGRWPNLIAARASSWNSFDMTKGFEARHLPLARRPSKDSRRILGGEVAVVNLSCLERRLVGDDPRLDECGGDEIPLQLGNGLDVRVGDFGALELALQKMREARDGEAMGETAGNHPHIGAGQRELDHRAARQLELVDGFGGERARLARGAG